MQTLRRAVDDPRRDDLPPHLTLVPPINLGDDAYRSARALLRSVAASSSAFELQVGPAGSFAPATPTLHLELQGDTESLASLRARVRTGPFDRDDLWPFHPHVTLREEQLDPEPTVAAEVLRGTLGPWRVDRLHLLEQRRDDDGRRRWVPVAEEPFGPAVVVGRGGVELELRCTTMIDETAVELLGGEGPVVDPFGSDLVVVATEPRSLPDAAPLGLAVGRLTGTALAGTALASTAQAGTDRVAHLRTVTVDGSARRQGIGRQLLRRWCHEAAARGAGVVLTPVGGDELDDLLAAEGFVQVGMTHVRQLASE